MKCDCRPDSACTSTSVCGENNELENVVEDLWINSKSVLTGAFTVVGFLLYRFSQALPFILRWPIRIFCSLTGLSSLWSWVSRVASTIRGLKTIGKWLSSLWKFTAALPNKLGWVSNVAKAIAGSLTNIKKCVDTLINLIQRLRGLTKKDEPQKAGQCEQTSIQSSPAPPSPSGPCDSGLRIILVGPPGAGRTLLGDTLLGCRGSFPRACRECVRQRAFVEGKEVTVVDTPDLLGSSLGAAERAREALRSIQLASPGPHAFLLVMPAPGSGGGAGDTDESAALEVLLVLMGEGALGHILPVLTHADSLPGARPSPS
ncbi:hypothetical protein GJAV_G00143170 [Gymnothorax javanicus]|nr:hypothetical protein GJAV_G00143170 [Gymnothorax javanicus]